MIVNVNSDELELLMDGLDILEDHYRGSWSEDAIKEVTDLWYKLNETYVEEYLECYC